MVKTENAINVIFPRLEQGVWVFTDPSRGLVNEPFILGVPKMIDHARKVLGLGTKLKFTFSKHQFPGSQGQLRRHAYEVGGAWYKFERFLTEKPMILGWLCPATRKYFPKFPAEIHFSVEAMTDE